MSKKELKILCAILAAGEAAWAFAWWTQHQTTKIQQRTIDIQEAHIALYE